MGQVPPKYFMPSAPYGSSDATNTVNQANPAAQNPQTPLLPPNFTDPGKQTSQAAPAATAPQNSYGGMNLGANPWGKMFGKLFILFFFLPSLLFATTTVTGKIQNLGTGNMTNGAFVRFWLRGCAGNQPRVNGTAVIGPSQGGVFFFDIAANSSGITSGTLYSTRDATGLLGGDIECGGSTTAVWYGMQIYVAGKGGPEVPVHALNGVTLNISNVTPITTVPVITAPTGDSTYCRLDGGNGPCPVSGTVTNATNATNLVGPGSVTGSFTGNPAFTGTISAGNINNLLTVDGTQYASLAAAFAACPAAGCTIDMRGNSSVTSLGTFDPGNSEVTLLLGPYFYTANQITLRSGLHIIGMGRSNATNSVTNIQGTNTTANSAVFVGPGPTQSPALGVVLRGFTLFAPGGGVSCSIPLSANSNVTDGILIDASSSTTFQSGLWFSELDDIQVCGFGGSGIHFKGGTGSGTNGVNQFVTMTNVQVFRALGANCALRIEGANYQFFFYNTMFESAYGNSGTVDTASTANVFIGGGPGAGAGGYPYIVNFNGATIEGAATLVQVDGGANITFDHLHAEIYYGGVLITYGGNGQAVATDTLGIVNSSFNGGAVNSGNGYLIKNTSTHTNGVTLRDSVFLAPGGSAPDHVIWDTSGALWTVSGMEINDGAGISYYNIPYNIGAVAPQLPSASLNPGVIFYVTDSTAITAEGQTCVGGGSVKALAISNGTVWKCF